MIKFSVSLKHIVLQKTNELFYAGAVVVTNTLGVQIDKVAGRKEPMWKRRLQNKIKELRKDVSQLEASKKRILVILDTGKDYKENVALESKDLMLLLKN